MGKKDNVKPTKKSDAIFVEQEEYEKVHNIGAEILNTEKTIAALAIRQRQMVDRLIFLEGQKIALQNELYKKYGIPEGSNVFIKEDLEVVINKEN